MKELTAAGLFRNFTWFPFNPLVRTDTRNHFRQQRYNILDIHKNLIGQIKPHWHFSFPDSFIKWQNESVSLQRNIHLSKCQFKSPKTSLFRLKGKSGCKFPLFWGYTQIQKDRKFTTYPYRSHNTHALHNKYLLTQQESHLFITRIYIL